MTTLLKGFAAATMLFAGYAICVEIDNRSRYRQVSYNPKPRPARPKGYVISDPNHPYWRHRLAQYWGYEVN